MPVYSIFTDPPQEGIVTEDENSGARRVIEPLNPDVNYVQKRYNELTAPGAQGLSITQTANVLFQVNLVSDEIDFTIAGITTVGIPIGYSFYVSECGVIATKATSPLTQPEVLFGVVAEGERFVAVTILTTCDVVGKRQVYATPLETIRGQFHNAGNGDLTFAINEGGAGDGNGHPYKGVAYFQGMLIKDVPSREP